MNRALDLLQKINVDNGKDTGYLIPIKWSILCVFKRESNVTLKISINIYLEGISLNMSAYIVHSIFEIYTGHW